MIIRGLLKASDHDPVGFSQAIAAYTRSKHVFLLSSGKAAMVIGLEVLKQASSRREVIVPAYCSFCLASALAQASLRVRLCDVDPATLDFDYGKLNSLISGNTLAIIPVHQFGLVCNMTKIRELATESGARVIEDAAQAFGASFGGRKTGTLGDLGILSFGRGKNLSTLGGGAILTDDDILARHIEEGTANLTAPPCPADLKSAATGLATSLFLNPRLYGIPSALPFLNLGANVYDPDFEVELMPRLNAAIGRRTLRYLDTYNNIRVENARILTRELRTVHGIVLPKPDPGGRSVFLRYPVLLPDSARRAKVFEKLSASGLGISCSYPLPLHRVPGFQVDLADEKDFPRASRIAETILTLPAHPYVKPDELRKIAEIVRSTLEEIADRRTFHWRASKNA